MKTIARQEMIHGIISDIESALCGIYEKLLYEQGAYGVPEVVEKVLTHNYELLNTGEDDLMIPEIKLYDFIDADEALELYKSEFRKKDFDAAAIFLRDCRFMLQDYGHLPGKDNLNLDPEDEIPELFNAFYRVAVFSANGNQDYDYECSII